jgi:hypothetical protein
MVLTSILSNSIAGLHKNATQVHESAHKIVNIQSSSTVTNLFQSPASLTSARGIDPQIFDANSSDLARDFINLIQAEAAYKSSAELIKVAESLSKVTRDIIA